MSANRGQSGSYQVSAMRSSHVASLALIAILAISLAYVWSELADTEFDSTGARTEGTNHVPAASSFATLNISDEDRAREAADAWRGRLRGQLVDSKDGTPVADYCLTIDDEILRSDDEGRFESKALPVGALRLGFLDAGVRTFTGYSASYTHSPGNKQDVRIPVALGPSYRLAMDLPHGFEVEDFIARLSSQGRSDRRTKQTPRWQAPEGLDLELYPHPINKNSSPFHAPLRQGSPSWVRFPFNVAKQLSSKGPWTIELLHKDGLARGSAEVNSVSGRYPQIVRIEFEALGKLTTRVFDEFGRWPKDCILSVKTMDGMFAGQARKPTSRRGEDSGAAIFRNLDPGHYTVRAIANGYFTAETSIAIGGGRGHNVRLDLTPIPRDHVISGTVISETGRFHAKTGILLSAVRLDTSQEFARAMTRVRWEEDGERWVGRFSFDRLPAGEYMLEPAGLGRPQWKEPELRVRAPSTNVMFECLDGGERFDLYMRVVDADSGQLLPEFSLTAGGDKARRRFRTTCTQSEEWTAGRPDPISGVDLTCPVTAGFSWEHALTWSVSADGYEAAQGDARAFNAEVLIEGQVARVAEVRLVASAAVQDGE
jgi:hypothetical protein